MGSGKLWVCFCLLQTKILLLWFVCQKIDALKSNIYAIIVYNQFRWRWCANSGSSLFAVCLVLCMFIYVVISVTLHLPRASRPSSPRFLQTHPIMYQTLSILQVSALLYASFHNNSRSSKNCIIVSHQFYIRFLQTSMLNPFTGTLHYTLPLHCMRIFFKKHHLDYFLLILIFKWHI